MNQLARYLSSIPGRKNLIWFSDNFPVSFFSDPGGRVPKNQDHIQKTSDMLTAAKVAIRGGGFQDGSMPLDVVPDLYRVESQRLGLPRELDERLPPRDLP